jgi:hypothetical protein
VPRVSRRPTGTTEDAAVLVVLVLVFVVVLMFVVVAATTPAAPASRLVRRGLRRQLGRTGGRGFGSRPVDVRLRLVVVMTHHTRHHVFDGVLDLLEGLTGLPRQLASHTEQALLPAHRGPRSAGPGCGAEVSM